MTFEAILQQTVDILQSRGRVSYRALQRQFELDDAYLADLKNELLYVYPQVVDDEGRGLVWTSETAEASTPVAVSPIADHASMRAPHAYTPPYLAEKILTSRSALEGERKQVTVLFADIKDSTELIKDLDPEDAQQLLDPAIHLMMEAVHRFEGTVNQVLGDGLMSLFGAPIGHEDHAARACYAALAMQAAMRDYTEEVRRQKGLELRIRVGLNSGEVVVRTIGNDLHMDYSAVGPTTHLAARMEQLAASGSIRLSAATLRLVEGLVQVNALGPVPVKGMSAPVEVYELTGVSTVRRRFQAAVARGLTRFVGRETEIDALAHALEQAGAGHGQIVAAVGEPGVGKSRLVYEFVHAHRTQGWLVLESTSVSYGKATPYLPVVDLLKRYVHVEDGDDPRTIRAKVTGHIFTLDETLQATIPALLSLLDALPEDSPFLQLDPPGRRQRTLDGLKRILRRESQVQPLLLVFEDLHWIDSETQALLDSLVESLPTAQLLLLVNYRPEYQHEWGSKTFYQQLRLDPLPPASAEAFLQALLGDDPSLEPLKKLLIERTEGNPFFLEESVRTLIETAMLVGDPGAYCLAQKLPSIHVPATVQTILAARIDRLPQEEKRLLQTAAVIGTEVPFSLLQAIAELSEEALHRGLTHLQAAEFLYETSLFPERVYAFKHALTHEVAYGSLLQERRRMLHAQIIEVFETLSGDRLADQVERLAHHALRGEVWDKALRYFRQAGDKAMEHSAHQEAVACFEQALDALSHLPKTRDTRELAIDLRLSLRVALRPSGDFGRILAYLREAEAEAEALNDLHRLGQVTGFLAIHFRILGAHDQGIAAGQRALACATASGDVVLYALANQHLGNVYEGQNDYRRAIDFFGETVASLEGALRCERHGQIFLPAVQSRALLAWCHAELGTFAKGEDLGDEGLRIAEVVEHPASLMIALYGIGKLSLRQGDLRRALPRLERSISICREVDLSSYFTGIAATLGAAYTLAGRVAEAVPLLTQAVEQRRAGENPQCLLSLSEAYLLAERHAEAYTRAERALELVTARKSRGMQAWILRLLGDIVRHRDPPDIDQAETHYQQALALATELGMRPLQAHCHRGLGTLYSQTGQSEQACAELSTAIEMYRDMEMTFWLPETEAKLHQLKS
jgi:class 3 adenylate cyclase/tetratricopeptide (TPR) repeat protein